MSEQDGSNATTTAAKTNANNFFMAVKINSRTCFQDSQREGRQVH